MSHFKTQQELWKYITDGGTVVHASGALAKFEKGTLNSSWSCNQPTEWQPYIEPVAKTKVWRWEKVETVCTGHKYLCQAYSLFTEEHAAMALPGYAKVPGSEREI